MVCFFLCPCQAFIFSSESRALPNVSFVDQWEANEKGERCSTSVIGFLARWVWTALSASPPSEPTPLIRLKASSYSTHFEFHPASIVYRDSHPHPSTIQSEGKPIFLRSNGGQTFDYAVSAPQVLIVKPGPKLQHCRVKSGGGLWQLQEIACPFFGVDRCYQVAFTHN